MSINRVLAFLLLFLIFSVSAFAEEMKVEKLEEEKVYVFDFKGASLSEVLKVFTDLTGKNVVAPENLKDLKITIFLKDVPPRACLEILCKLYSLWYKEDETHIRLMKVEDYGKDILVQYEGRYRIYSLKYASARAVADTVANLMPEQIEYTEPGEWDSYGHIGGGMTGGMGAGIGVGAGRDMGMRGIGRGMGSGGVGRAVGGARVTRETKIPLSELTPDLLEKIEEERVKVEEAPKIKEEELAKIRKEKPVVRMTIFMPTNTILIYSVNEEILNEVMELIQKLDTPIRQVLLEGKILRVTLSDDFSSFFQFEYKSKSGKHALKTAYVPIKGSTLTYLFTDLPELKMRMELLQKDGRLDTIATPMVLAANNAQAYFFVGEQRPVTVNYEYEVREFEQRTTEIIRPVIKLEGIGTVLTITPVINEDRTVTLNLNMELSSINIDGAKIRLVKEKTGDLVVLPVDTVNRNTISTILSVSDGNVLVIGGLVDETSSIGEEKVPLLGDIPLLGFFFKKKVMEKKKMETVMVIIPHIMMGPEEAERSVEPAKEISEHPYIKRDEKRILQYDERREKLKPLGR
jgi:general secretion pathway protein D